METHIGQDEPWKKVFGPVFIYLNSAADGDDPLWLWEDAKIKVPPVKSSTFFFVVKLLCLQIIDLLRDQFFADDV